MLYGSGQYDIKRETRPYTPAPRVRPEAVEIAQRHQGADMRRCLDVPRQSVFGRQAQSVNASQARGATLKGPIPVDPTYNGGKYSNRSTRPVPRVKPEAHDIASKARGTMDVNLGQYGKPDPMMYGESRGVENINPKEGPMRKVGIKGPILVDPIYNEGKYSGRSARPVPRVKSEASEIAEKSKGCIQNLLKNPDVSKFRQAKPKKQPTDHGQANLNRMRQIKRQSREREREKEQNKPTPVKALWKSTRYDSVEPKVKTIQTQTPRAPRDIPPRPSTAPPGKSRNSHDHTETDLTPRRAAQKRADDFITRNARLAKTYKPQRSKSQMEIIRSGQMYEDGLKKYNTSVKGSVPKYLQERQREWSKLEKERRLNAPDPSVPEGHRLLSDKDRKDTLKVLKETKESTRVKEKYYIPTYSSYGRKFYGNDEGILVEQLKKHESVEKTKYILPNKKSPGNSLYYNQQEISDTEQPISSYYGYPDEEPYSDSRQNYYPSEYNDRMGETSYRGQLGTSSTPYLDHTTCDYIEYPSGEVVIIPSKYNQPTEDYAAHMPEQNRIQNEMMSHPTYFMNDGALHYHSYTPDSETSFRRRETVPVFSSRMKNDSPTKVTHQDKNKQSKNYTKCEERHGYRKYETGVKTKEKSSKLISEYSPRLAYHHNYVNQSPSHNFDEQDYRDNHHNSFDNPQYRNSEAGDYIPYDDSQDFYLDNCGRPTRFEDSPPQHYPSRMHQPHAAISQRPMTALYSRPTTAYGTERYYTKQPTPPRNSRYQREETDRAQNHVTFAPTPDVQPTTPSDCLSNQSMIERVAAASVQSTYKDQYKDPVSYENYFRHRADHKVELLQEHRLLPIRSADSVGVRQRKTDLERRIAEVDEAIRVFERPRVLVKNDQ